MGLRPLTAELRKEKSIMIDTNVVIYFLEGNEIFGSLSREVFSTIEKGEVKGYISVVTVAEVLIKPMKQGDNFLVDRITRFLKTFPNLYIVDIDKTVAMEAAKIRSKTGLKMPDALIIASAKVAGSAIVGTDNEWNNKDMDLTFYNIAKYRT